MSHNIFGWSYPPGCSRVPGDEPDPPCSRCGEDIDNCTCPECPTCSTHGCLEHMNHNDFINLHEKVSIWFNSLEREYQRRVEEAAINCPGCNSKLLPNLYDRTPIWCDKCSRLVS